MSSLKSSWDPFLFFNTHIRPYAENKFADAPILLLCGSQARQLNGQNLNLPSDTSDFDFVILYDKLPPKYEAAMFSSETLHIPGHPDPVNLDFKIMDVDYLNDHAKFTREIRRFPFLFNMILDAYPIHDKANKLPLLKQKAEAFLKQGPADLPREQIAATRTQLDAFEQALDNATDKFDIEVLAYEGVPLLATAFLRSHLEWESSVGARGLQYIQKSPLAGKDNDIIDAYKKCLKGDKTGYKTLIQDAKDQLNKLDAQIPANTPANPAPKYDLVTDAERLNSDSNGMRIMLNQYVGDLRAGQKKGPYRATEILGQFVIQLKQAIALQSGEAVKFGAAGLTSNGQVPFSANIAEDIVKAMQKKDFDYVENLTDIVIAPFGGLNYDYLERVYVDDLHRRRALQQAGSTQHNKKDPWSGLKI